MEMKVFLKKLIGILFALLICLAGCNYFFDKTGILNPDFSTYRCEPTQSYIKARYICENPDNYNAFCFGSSRVGNIDLSKINNGYVYYNMTYSEGLPQEWLEDIELFLKHGVCIRQVILGLDDFSFRVNPQDHHSQELRLRYTNEFSFEKMASLLFKKPSFSGYKETEKSGSIFDIYRTGRVIHEYPDRVIESNVEQHINDVKFRLPKHYEGDRISETIDTLEKISKICSDNDIELIVFFNPIHKTTYYDTDFSEFLAFKKELAQVLPYYDFAWMNSITTDNYYYYETSHYRPIVGDMIIKNIFSANEIDKDIVRYVDKSNIEEHLIFLEKNRNLYEK